MYKQSPRDRFQGQGLERVSDPRVIHLKRQSAYGYGRWIGHWTETRLDVRVMVIGSALSKMNW